ADIPYQILEKRALAFHCTCSKEKIEQALVSLGREELADMVSQKEETEVTCEFCRQVWKFTKKDLEQLLAETGS
ncbi:MAG: Hsp33 family molecular chaperone HslO, partial [Geobacteraceae bacterium]|nr:Hsp33 family molecular chaperone HslO [Geobacteraceae bacterium]